MPAEKGIFLDVLPRFDMAAMGAILSSVEGMFKKSGAAMGTTFGKEAEVRIAALAEAERKSANVTEDAELRKVRAVHGTEIAEQQATLATDRRVLAAQRLATLQASETASENSLAAAKLRVEAAAIAETRATYAASDAALAQTARTRDLAVAQGLSAKAADAHAGAVAASAVTAGNAGRAFNIAGVAMAGGFLLAAGESTKMAGNFQQSMIKLTASAGETQGNLKVVGDGILQLAGQVGISANTLADSMFLVEKAGFRGGDGIKVLTAAAQLANAEGADLNDTINGLTTTMNDFGFKTDQAALVASKMNVAAGDSKAPLQQFSSALHNVEPVAAMAKVGIDEVYAAMARITQSGAGADQASEWLNNTITHLMNMNDQQKTFLQQIKMDPVGLQQDLRNPAIGMSGVITEISDKIKSQLNPAQQLVLDTQFQSVQAVQSLNKIYGELSPKAKAVADQIKAGTADKGTLGELRVGRTNEPNLTAWYENFRKLDGVNAQLKKGQGDLMGVAAAFAKAFGTDSGLKVVSLLAGTPEQAAAMTAELKKLQTTTAEADGTVKGFNETQTGLNKKLADAKAGFGAAAIQVGNLFIPAMTWVANVLKDVAQYLAQNKVIMDTVVVSLGVFTTAWLLFKTAAIGASMWGTISSGLGMMLTKLGLVQIAAAETAVSVASIGTASVVAEGEVVAASATGATAIGAEGAAAVTTAGEVAAIGTAAIGAAAAAAGVVTGATAAGNWIANKIQGTNTGWMDVVKQGIDAPGRIWSGITHGGDIYANDGIQVDVEHNKDFQTIFGNQDKGATVDHRGKKPGSAGGDPSATPGALDPLAALSGALGTPGADVPTSIDPSVWNGGGAGGAGGAAAPVGTHNNPIYIDPSAITDGVNSSDMGASGSVGGGMLDIFTNAGSGGFTLPNIAKLMGTFVANLALGNPAGKLATGVGMGGDVGGGDLAVSVADIENMTPTQRLELKNQLKFQKAKHEYKKAQIAYAKAVATGKPGAIEDAEMAMLDAGDNVALVYSGQQQAGTDAAQRFADDNANGTATKNPGKYAKDKAAAAAYSGGATPSDAALLSNVPAGQYVNPGGTYDLSKGLADCSSAVGDLVKQMDGQATGGADRLNTGNAAEWLTKRGFLPGEQPGAFNVGYNSGHMQATLPGGTHFNWGSDPAAAKGGVDGTGADDPSFTSHYYRPVGTSGQPGQYQLPVGQSMTDAGLTNPVLSGPTRGDSAAAAAGANLPLSDVLFGGGNGPIFKRSPTTNGGGGAGGPSPFAPGGALSAIPSAPVGTPGPFPNPGGPGGQSPGRIGPFGAPPSVAAAAPHQYPGANPAINGVNPGAAPVGQPASPGVQSSQPVGGTGKGGVGISSGLMGGLGAAASVIPGGQMALQEGNRAAQYMGQVAGILMSGALETFTLHGANGAGGNGGWLGKIAGGLAGAHKTSPNTAGSAPGLDPSAKEPAPPLKPGDPPPGGPKPGDPNSPGPGNGNNTINIATQNINHDDGGANNRDAMRQLQAFPGM